MVEPHSSNFRVITTNFLGVRIFRKFTVLMHYPGSYHNGPKFSDRLVSANSADPDQTAPQGLHCLQFPLHLLDALLYDKATLFQF